MTCFTIRVTSPELPKSMASFPFSPRPLSPRANNSDHSGDASNQKQRAPQSILQLPDLLPTFRTFASSSAPFSASNPGSPSSQRRGKAKEALGLELKEDEKLDFEGKECESSTLGSQMAIFPADPFPLVF